MAEEISKTYPPVAEPVATFDSEDLASGTGIQNYYPTVGETSAAYFYFLSESSDLDSWLPQTHTTAAGTVTLTFDSAVFNLPRFVKGTAVFSAYMVSDTIARAISCTAQLWHWDGTTAVALTAKAISADAEVDNITNSVFLKLPVTVEKMVKKGEQLRLIVEFINVNGAANSYIGHSPTNQTKTVGNLANTKMVIGVPFRIGV